MPSVRPVHSQRFFAELRRWCAVCILAASAVGSPLLFASPDAGAVGAARTPAHATDLSVDTSADEQIARDRFDQAMRLVGEKGQAQAAVDLVALADQFPHTTLAPEALFAAAQQYEESLSSPSKALLLYRRVVSDYPDSRLHRRAESRVSQLDVSLRSGETPLTTFQHIVRSTPDDSLARTQQLERLLTEQPSFALADEVMYLLLDGALRRSDDTVAVRHKRLVAAFPHSEWTARGKKIYADWLLRRGKLDLARTTFASLADHPAPLWQKAAAEGLRAVAQAENRRLLAAMGGLTLFGSLLFLGFRHRQRLWPPPIEVLYYLPVGLFFLVVASLLQNGVFVRPLAVLGLGGALLCWLSAAAARADKARSLALGLLWRAALAALLCYLAIERQGLWDLVLETLRNGPEG